MNKPTYYCNLIINTVLLTNLSIKIYILFNIHCIIVPARVITLIFCTESYITNRMQKSNTHLKKLIVKHS